jgi:phosphate transport system substrate-binding protein
MNAPTKPADGTKSTGVDPHKLAAVVMQGASERATKRYYDAQFDLSGLPAYEPRREVTRTLAQWGNHYIRLSGLAAAWEAGFRKYHPNASFNDNLASSSVAFSGLVAGVADMAQLGRQAIWDELQAAQRQDQFGGGPGRVPLEVTVCTGSYNVPGWTFALGVFVNEANPIGELSVQQLDGIFGSERRGGWIGLEWDSAIGRGSDRNIRTWGQAGLTGEWAQRPINVYGYNLNFHFPDEFAKKVFGGGRKWNEQLRDYANDVVDGKLFVAGDQMMRDLANDPYGIAYTGLPHHIPGTKPLALSEGAGTPAVPLSLESVQSRTYPLTRDVFCYVMYGSGSGTPKVNPDAGEFLRYVVSREGQQMVQEVDGKYLPLTAAESAAQLDKLDQAIF